MNDYRQVEYYDETAHVSRADWPEGHREPEVCAAELTMHDYHESLTWIIAEARWSAQRQAWTKERERLLRIYSVWRSYVTHWRNIDSAAHVRMTAQALGVTAAEVRWTLNLVDSHGLLGMVA